MQNREIDPAITSVILFLVSLATLECAITLHHEDFIVTNFGMKNGNRSLLFKVLQESLMILH